MVTMRPRPTAGPATTPSAIAVALCVASVGCAHHRADQYAYAPPYAPPVYPQPQIAGVPPVTVTPGPAPMTAVAPATVMAAAVPTAQPLDGVVPAVGGACPPCTTGEGMIVPTSGLVEGGGQTPPCPPGP
ncbi:MAG: hypothetical protein RLZZ111_1269 [Planctomycetota bacterium]|jgi:hypothetical protein